MSEFDDARAQLNDARRQEEAARTELLHAREREARLGREVERLSRTAADRASADRIEQLEQEVAEVAREIAALDARYGAAVAGHGNQLKRFAGFDDPTREIERLPDSFPLALFPLRLETRFKGNELWVRAFPDDALVDTFHPDLSEAELASARTYWANVWAAGGDPDGRKAAWRVLARSHGAGRAKWIVDSYAPLDPGAEPERDAGEHILVIVPPVPVTDPDERRAIGDYWSAVWSSRGSAREEAYRDLENRLGAARAAEVVEKLVPVNVRDAAAPPDPSVTVEVAFLDLPAPDGQPTTQASWARGARSWLLPERLVLMGFNGETETLRVIGNQIPSELQVGPDPSAPRGEQLRADGEDIAVPDKLLWTVDFDEAVRVGMGFVAQLDDAQAARGFDRLLVLGVRLSSDPADGATRLEELVRHHQASRKGLSLLPQGSPTNNTDEASSGYTWWEDPDASYRHFFELDHDNDPDDWRLRCDGAWLAGMLGIDRELLKGSPGYFGADQAEARAMNVALWPATLGYFMEQMMAPVLSDRATEETRDFFNRFVLGRGTVPAIRIGRQPYGILPATAWSRMSWFRARAYAAASKELPPPAFLGRLRQVVDRAAGFWTAMAADVPAVGDTGGDPQQRLLDIVGLHPTSAEFYQRYAESFEQLYNRLAFSLFGLTPDAQAVARNLVQAGLATLAQFGYTRATGAYPEILDKFFLRTPNLLQGALVDAVLSDTAPLSVDRSDGDNYLAWLQRAARDSHDALRRQEGFAHGPPTALLYLMLHHALDLGYVETSLLLHREAGLMTDAEYLVARREPKFIHVEKAEAGSGSRWEPLYQTAPAITGDPQTKLGDFIPSVFDTATPYLREQLEALDVLKDAPSGALERAFVEHLDCCSYRFDAWRSAFVGCQLSYMRGESEGKLSRRGILIGAYGWVEDLRPDPREPEPARIDPELSADFERPGDAPLLRDPANNGHIHAPSPDHAVTAAILRNGYLANATPANPETLSIDLSSDRVRLALATIDGIRNGQPLGALLGYQLERSLHDSGDLFLDRVIYPLRQRFPLAGNRMESTRAEDEPITAVEARNVVDGLAFAEYLEETGADNYPYGLTGLPDLDDLTDTTSMSAAQVGAVIDAAVARMRSIGDAVADAAMAEGVYQVVKGNYDRAAGTMDAFSKGNFPPTPEVVETPRSGRTLTHRVALHLEGGLDPADPANVTPRAKGEPALNAWLTGVLPPMAQVFAAVEYFDHASGTERRLTPSMADLGVEPIDLFYMVDEGGEREMPGFDDLLIHHAARDATAPPRDDADFRLIYKPDSSPGFTLFEVVPLVRSLRGAILGSRPLQATDVMLVNEADSEADTGAVARPEKVTAVVAALDTEAADLRTTAATLEAQVGPGVADAAATAAAVAHIDAWADAYADALRRISPFGLRAAGLTTPQERVRPLFSELHTTIAALVVRWQEKLRAFDSAIAGYGALPGTTTPDDRFAALVSAGRIVSTAVVAPLPPTPDALLATVTGFRGDLVDALDDVKALLEGAQRLGAFYAAVVAFAPRVAAHDLAPLDLSSYPAAIRSIADELRQRAAQAVADVDGRIAAANDILPTVATAPAREQPRRVGDAMKAVLGEQFVVLVEFKLPATARTEWSSVWAARAGLLNHLTSGPDAIPFPVDDWLHGVGRVREKARHLESAALIGHALSVAEALDLDPLQFPFVAGDGWLGLRFPATLPNGDPFELIGDRLLYTAHLAPGAEVDAADPDRLYCGVLVDEWSELIAADVENTGLAFHYDRPSTEAPQAILLATPPEFTGAWRWDDLVDTLGETLDFARMRAVEPAQIDGTELGRFLPALISAVTLYPLTVMLNYSENNALSTQLAEVVDE